MPFTTPKTWAVDELLTANDMNTHIRDNLAALKDPPSDLIVRDNGALYSTTSTTIVAIDSTNLRASITTTGGDVWVHFTGTIHADQTNGRQASFDLSIDGGKAHYTELGYASGYQSMAVASTICQAVNIDFLISGLAAGAHTFDIMWMINAGTLYLHSDTSDNEARNEQPAILWAREVS